MEIREVTLQDAQMLWDMMCRLDEETPFMMFEPGERKEKMGGPDNLRKRIEHTLQNKDLLILATDEEKIVGFLSADREVFNRCKHKAYIVIGLLQSYRNRKIGTRLFEKMQEWAQKENVLRLELTVECNNTVAKHLYDSQGFEIEGTLQKSMFVHGRFVDEYMMAKIAMEEE